MVVEININLHERETVQNPWNAVRSLQMFGPVIRNTRTGSWLITTDRLCRQVLTDSMRFKVKGNISQEGSDSKGFFLIDDKARHDQLRNIWANAFAPHTLQALLPMLTELADQLLEPIEARMHAGEVVDLDQALCQTFPAYVLAHMLGMSEQYRDDVVRWGYDLGAASNLPSDPSRDTHPAWIKAQKARDEIGAYLAEAIADRRRNPGTDLISQFVNSPLDLPDEVIIANCRQLPGPQVTAKWIGHIVVALAEHPEVRDELVAQPALIRAAAEEVLRVRPVTMALERTVSGGNVDLDGVEVPEGANVVALICCANRDPARYDEPERFNIHRKYRPNLGFGVGLHCCLGMALARLEAETVIRGLLERIPDYTLPGPVVYDAFGSRGPVVLPVALPRERARNRSRRSA